MEALASSVISLVFFKVLAYTLPHSSKLKTSTRIRTQYVNMDVDDMLKKCLPKVDKYVIDKELLHTDFIVCVAPNACRFMLENIRLNRDPRQ